MIDVSNTVFTISGEVEVIGTFSALSGTRIVGFAVSVVVAHLLVARLSVAGLASNTTIIHLFITVFNHRETFELVI